MRKCPRDGKMKSDFDCHDCPDFSSQFKTCGYKKGNRLTLDQRKHAIEDMRL